MAEYKSFGQELLCLFEGYYEVAKGVVNLVEMFGWACWSYYALCVSLMYLER